jgi:hypothetical protein
MVGVDGSSPFAPTKLNSPRTSRFWGFLLFAIAMVWNLTVGSSSRNPYTSTMLARCRPLILWLLLLALPMQGWAVVTMLHCGSSHRTMEHAQLGVSNHPAVEQATLHGHDHHAAAHDVTHDSPAQLDADNEVSASQCSVCASCCSGVALLESPTVFVGASSVTASRPALSVPALSFFTGGPDRPPRLSLV